MRKKILSILTILLIILNSITVAAFANNNAVEVSSSYKYITTGEGKEAGTIEFKYPSNGNFTGASGEYIHFIVDLPQDVKFQTVPIGTNVIDDEVEQEQNMSSLDFESGSSKRIHVKVEADEWTTGSYVKIKFKDDLKLDIEDDFTGDLMVKIEVIHTNDNENNLLYQDFKKIAEVYGEELTIETTESPKAVTVGYNKEGAEIEIKENTIEVLKTNDIIKFTIMTNDVTFNDDSQNTISATSLTLDSNSITLENNNKVLKAVVSSSSSIFCGEVIFLPKINISPNVDGNIKIKVEIEDNNGTIKKKERVTVAKIGEEKISFDITDADDTIYAGAVEKDLDVVIKASPATGGDFQDGDMITFELLNGKFENVPYVENGTVLLYANDKAFCVFTDQTDEIEISNIEVSIKPDVESGPLKLKVAGDYGTRNITIADIEKPFTVESISKPEMLKNTPMAFGGEIIISESDAGVLKSESVDIIYLEFPFGVMLSSIPTVTVLTGDLEIDNDNIELNNNFNRATLKIPIETESTEESKIIIQDIIYTVMPWALNGDLNIKIKGDELGGYIYDQKIFATVTNGVIVETLSTPDGQTDDPNSQSDPNGQEGQGATQDGQADPNGQDGQGDPNGQDGQGATQDGQADPNGEDGQAEPKTYEFTVDNVNKTVVIRNNRALLRVNILCDKLGLEKSWDPVNRIATFYKDDKIVSFPIGVNEVLINGTVHTVDQGAEIIDDFTYVPIRRIQEAFGGEILWDPVTKTVTYII